MKQYPTYKESKIDWIANIPNHWHLRPLRRITKEHRQGYYIDAEYIDSGVKLTRITDLQDNGRIEYSEMPFVKITSEHEKIYSILNGDFLFPRTGSIGLLGFVKNPERAVFASYLIRFRFNNKEVLPDYLYYFFISDAFISGVFSDLHGGVNQNIHAENIKNQSIAFPDTLHEQQIIIEYLKTKTGLVEEFISNRQKQIDFLQEQKVSIINNAITRGVTGNEKLKKSETTTLDYYPENWVLTKIKFLLQRKRGAIRTGPFGTQLKNSDLVKDGAIKIYNQRTVIDKDFKGGEEYISQEKFETLKEFVVYPNDLLITTRGTIGRCAIFPKDVEKGVLHPCLIRLQLNQKKILNEYAMLCFENALFFQEEIKLLSNSTVIEVIYSYNLKEVFIPLPSVEEQKLILNHIKKETEILDNLISKYQKQTDLMQEYTAAIISQAVTGKIDVREWQPKTNKMSV